MNISFIHSMINGYLGRFLFGAIMISAAMASFLHMIFMWTYVCISIGHIYTGMELPWPGFWGMSGFSRYWQRVFQEVVQISIPTGSEWKFRLLHIFAYPWYHCLFVFILALCCVLLHCGLKFVSQKTNEVEHFCKQAWLVFT